MNQTLKKVLMGQENNHMLPFFWQHGEDEATLREYMKAIYEANCRAVCVESRPHPDFAGPKWWQDMDVILDEARKRDMKVWILDDSHFPTGYANGALKNYPDSACKQNIFMTEYTVDTNGSISLDLYAAGLMEIHNCNKKHARVFLNDETVLFVIAKNADGETLDITDCVDGRTLYWDKPEGKWTLQIGVRSRNTGGRRDHIGLLEEESVQILIDAVYEPHWAHYADDFGKTIAGFFSDEPELGNGPTYAQGNVLGTEQDLPWGPSMETIMSDELGENWRALLTYLWKDGEDAPRVRMLYMDRLTKLVRRNFSRKLGGWCEAHGVEYIGHLIEDGGQHCRTGSTLGHYFRGLGGQHMSGIDNIGGQVLPQGEDNNRGYFNPEDHRDGEFYQYALAKLAQSAAAIEPKKKNRAMCEIFGNYFWKEGVRLEKYQADHFLVRGINHFVPHAFSAKKFPDFDCPPHFYADGHDPLYRHFGALCGYMNRVATVTSSGKHVVPVAVLYHGELEWADAACMPFEKPLRELYDRQIDCHVIPTDIFTEKEDNRTVIGNPLTVNGQKYHAFIIPEANYLPKAAAEGLSALVDCGLPVYFVNSLPACIAETGEALPENLAKCPVAALSALYDEIAKLGLDTPVLSPANNRIRILQINGDTPVYYIVNEDAKPYNGTVTLTEKGDCYLYDPWFNVCRLADVNTSDQGVTVRIALAPLSSIMVAFGDCDVPMVKSAACDGKMTEIKEWTRSVCESVHYPAFADAQTVTLPDIVSDELPDFSGFIRYEAEYTADKSHTYTLEITDAMEGVEVFVNGKSLGIQIAPPFIYDMTDVLIDGTNKLAIEVATTAEREVYAIYQKQGYRSTFIPEDPTGITGRVRIYMKECV